jgi:tetratricopeptide (TPR) repeat protein
MRLRRGAAARLTYFMPPPHNVPMKYRHSRGVKAGPVKPPASSSTLRFSDAAGWALIFCATVAAYLPALNGDLLWDDGAHLTRPELQSFHGLWRIWFDVGATQQYYPLLHSAFWLEHRLWGNAVAGYHLTNIALHAVSACLVVMIVRRLSLPGAWLAGFVFALHPVYVEGVAWISEQKSTLSGVFCLASLLAYLYFDQTRQKSKYLLATGLFVLALLSKTVTAVLPAVLLVIFWWQRGHLTWRRDVLPLVPWLALGSSTGLFTAWIERTVIGARGTAFLLTPAQHFLLAGRAISFYAGKLLWPADLTFSYAHWKLDPAVWWQWLFPAGTLALAIGLGVAARRHRAPLASFLIFAGALFPVLGLLNVYPFRYSYVADHFQYLASLGIIVPATSVLIVLLDRTSAGKMVTVTLSAMLLLVLATLTWRQAGAYRDVETLYRQTLARNPDSWLAHNNLSVILLNRPGGLQAAIAESQAALRLEPGYHEGHNNLGSALLQLPSRLPDAITELQESLRIKPDYADAHNNLGTALSRMPGRLPDAIAEYQEALRIRPDYAEAHNNLGGAFTHIPGRLPDAIAEYQAALRIRPDNPEAHENLASAYARIPGRLPDAIAEHLAALRIRPDYAEAHYNLGNAVAQTPGRLQDAITEYQAALRIKPDYAEAHYNLGLTLSQIPNRLPDAIAEYQAALRLRPDNASTHNNLGAALSRIPGRLPEAVAEYQTALRIQPDLVEAHNNLGDALSLIPGRLPDAIAEYRAALRIRPDFLPALQSMEQLRTAQR